jgi:hypothetical protein
MVKRHLCLTLIVHSIEGLNLIYVDWELHFGAELKIRCPMRMDVDCAQCVGYLKRQCSNFSKNQKLFPIFCMNGVPSWCVVKPYVCNSCNVRIKGNHGRLLMCLPEYVRNAYPVEPKFAYSKSTYHLD